MNRSLTTYGYKFALVLKLQKRRWRDVSRMGQTYTAFFKPHVRELLLQESLERLPWQSINGKRYLKAWSVWRQRLLGYFLPTPSTSRRRRSASTAGRGLRPVTHVCRTSFTISRSNTLMTVLFDGGFQRRASM
jgi:hypothetical protein